MLYHAILQKPDLSSRVALLGAMSVLLSVVFSSAYLFQSRQATLDQADQNARQLTRTLEVGVSATFQSAEVVVDFVAAQARANKLATPTDRDGALIQIAQQWPFIQSVSFIDHDGHMRHAVVRDEAGTLKWSTMSQNMDLSARPTFQTHAVAAFEMTLISILQKRIEQHRTQ